MLAVLMLNRMTSRKRLARKQRLSKSLNGEVKDPEKDYCRTCLQNEDLESIFPSKELEKKLSHELKLVTGLEIKMDDGFSQKMCSKCKEAMTKAMQFRRTSQKAEKRLKEMTPSKKSNKKYKLRKKATKTHNFNNTNEITPEGIEVNIEYDVGDDFQNDDVFEQDITTQDMQEANQNETYVNIPVNDVDVSKVANEQVTAKPQGRRKRQQEILLPPYKCNICGKELRLKSTYKAHMRFHTNYCVCEACGKRCRNNNQLQEHKRARHGLGRIHKCAYCEYSSATKEALTIHERRHTGERPYVCDHCGATFHRRSNLVQHIAIHLPEKNFQCDLCPKRLKSRKFLQIHKHNMHTGKRYGYLCSICGNRFEKPNKVRHHVRRVHGVPDERQGRPVRVVL